MPPPEWPLMLVLSGWSFHLPVTWPNFVPPEAERTRTVKSQNMEHYVFSQMNAHMTYNIWGEFQYAIVCVKKGTVRIYIWICVCIKKFWKHTREITENTLSQVWPHPPKSQHSGGSQDPGQPGLHSKTLSRKEKEEARGKKQRKLLGLDGRQKVDLALRTSKQCFPWPCLLECLLCYSSLLHVTVCACRLPCSKESLKPKR